MVADKAIPHAEGILAESGIGPFHLALEKNLANHAGTTDSLGTPKVKYIHSLVPPSVLNYFCVESSKRKKPGPNISKDISATRLSSGDPEVFRPILADGLVLSAICLFLYVIRELSGNVNSAPCLPCPH
jgi:hypothetical protein